MVLLLQLFFELRTRSTVIEYLHHHIIDLQCVAPKNVAITGARRQPKIVVVACRTINSWCRTCSVLQFVKPVLSLQV